MATLEQLQGVLDRGLQDKVNPNVRLEFDEALRRGLIVSAQVPVLLENQNQVVTPQSPPEGQAGGEIGFLDSISDSIKSFNDVALNTATFGASDTIKGAISALQASTVGQLLGGEDVDIGQAFREPGERREKFQSDNPKTAIAASIVGGFLNPVSKAAGPLIAGGKSILGKASRGGVGGAGLSGTQTAGEVTSESLRDISSGKETNIPEKFGRVGEATVIGAAFGGLIPPTTGLLKFGSSETASFLGRFSSKLQGTRALRKVAEALERDGFTPSQALKRIEQLGPEGALLDAGPNTRALGFTVKGLPGAGKKKIEKFVMERQEGIRNPKTGKVEGGQVNRIQDSLDELIPDQFFTQKQRLANINNASKLYDSAYAANQNIESTSINRLLRTPSGKDAFRAARITLNNNKENLSRVDPELTELLKETGVKATGLGVGRGLKLRFLDQVKIELFDLAEAATDKFGKSTARSRSIHALRRELIDELDNVDATSPGVKGGDYQKARLLAGDKLATVEALEKGREFMSKGQFSSPREVGIFVEELSPEAKHMFRVGASQGLKDRISDVVSRADATKKLLDIQSLEGKISSAFGDEALFRDYTKFMTNEKDLFRAVTDVLGNSKTAERGAALADASIDPGRVVQGLRDLASGQPGSIARGTVNLFGGIKDKALMPDKQADAIATILTGRSVKGLKETLPSIRARTTDTGVAKSLDELLIRGASSVVPRLIAGQ